MLGCAYKTSDVLNDEASSEKVENGLIFIGFVGMIDPCRDEVFDAIDRCKSAGIRPIMITGDHIDTAVAIAKQLKIINDAKNAVKSPFVPKNPVANPSLVGSAANNNKPTIEAKSVEI